MKICIFGSSFNPPHNAHMQIVEGLKKLNFDKLLIVPTGKPNHKHIGISDNNRKLLIEEFAKLCEVEVSYHEMENNFEYTMESLDYLQLDDEWEIYFAIGGDSLNNLRTWDYYEQLINRVAFVVVPRPGEELDQSILKEVNYQLLDVMTDAISSTSLRQHINVEKMPKSIYEVCEKLDLYK